MDNRDRLVLALAVAGVIGFIGYVVSDQVAHNNRKAELKRGKGLAVTLKGLRRRIVASEDRLFKLQEQLVMEEQLTEHEAGKIPQLEKGLMAENEVLMAVMLEVDKYGSTAEGMHEKNRQRKRHSVEDIQRLEALIDSLLKRVRQLHSN